MSYSRSLTNENGTIPTDTDEDQELTASKNYSLERLDDTRKTSYNECFEQTIVHKWFLSDIQSLNNQKEDSYVQSSSFGCTGENGMLHWIIRFYPEASKLKKTKCLFNSFDNRNEIHTNDDKTNVPIETIESEKNNQQISVNPVRNKKDNDEKCDSLLDVETLNKLFNEILPKQLPNINQSICINEQDLTAHTTLPSKEPIHASLLEKNVISETLQDSVISNQDETESDNKSCCVFEILKVNGYQESSQVLFESFYQVFEVADDGILMLLKTEGRYQAHFDRALIILPHDVIFSNSSNNILFSIKLIIYECSTTVAYWQPMSYSKTNIKNLLHEQSTSLNVSFNDTDRLFTHYPTIELSIRNLFWLMSIQKLFTDIKLYSSDGQEFHLHRIIVCTSCEKFTELISMAKDSNIIKINSINGISLKHILKYIYTGNIDIYISEFSIEEIHDLLNATDFFELFQLKNILTKKCLNHITEKNCLDLLRIADDKQMKILKNRIIIFLCQQYPQIFNTDTWKQFVNIRPHLYKETFENLLSLNHLQKSIIENNSKKTKAQ